MTNERPRTRLSSEKDEKRTVENAAELGSAATRTQTHTHKVDVALTAPVLTADPPSSLPSPISPYSHFSYLLPYTFHRQPPFFLFPTVSFLVFGEKASKDQLANFSFSWKHYDFLDNYLKKKKKNVF